MRARSVRNPAGSRHAAAVAGGLSAGEAAGGLARYGPNELPTARTTPVCRLMAGQRRDPLILVLLAAARLTLANGDLTDAAVIVLVIVCGPDGEVIRAGRRQREARE